MQQKKTWFVLCETATLHKSELINVLQSLCFKPALILCFISKQTVNVQTCLSLMSVNNRIVHDAVEQ